MNKFNINKKEFDQATMEVLEAMREQYPSITMSDLQTVAMFSKMFKEMYLTQ